MKPIKILFIFFSFFTLYFSLQARDVLSPLVKSGEPFINRADYFIPKRSISKSLAISPDGKRIISGSKDGSIKIWDINKGKVLKILKGHTSSITSLVISNDGKTIVSGSYDKTIKIWDISSGKTIRTLYGNKGTIMAVALSLDGKIVVSGEYHKSITIWDVSTGKRLKTIKAHNSAIESVSISPDTKTIVSSSAFDYIIKVWDISTGKILKVLQEDEDKDFMYSSVRIIDSKRIIVAFRNGNIKIRDISTGKILKTLKGNFDNITSLSISPDEKTFVSAAGNNIKIWDIERGQILNFLKGHTANISSLVISNDSKTIVSSSFDKTIKIWDIKTGKMVRNLKEKTSFIKSVASNLNKEKILIGSDDGSIMIWNRFTGKINKIGEANQDPVTSLSISPDGKTLVSSFGNFDIYSTYSYAEGGINELTIWDINTEKKIRSLVGHKNTITSVVTSPNGKTIVSGSWDKTIKIWDSATGKELRSLTGHTDPITSIAISSNGKIIVSSSVDKTIKIWDSATGKELRSLEGHTNIVSVVKISPDNKTIVSCSLDKSLKVWDINTGKTLRSLEGHTDSVRSIAISPDGEMIVSGSVDKTIKIWDINTGKMLKSLEGLNDSVISIIISSDGNTIISASKDGTIKEWKMDKKEWQKELTVGEGSTWIIFDNDKKKFFRGDDGTLLYKKNGTALSLALPRLPKEDKIKLKASKKISMTNKTLYPYEVSIKNIAKESLYWLKTEYHDKYCTLLEQRISNLEAKAEQNLTLNFNCSLPRKNPKPIKNHKINLVFKTATKSKFELPIMVNISYADINISKVEISEDGKTLNIEIKNIGNEKLLSADINLSAPFQAEIVKLTNLEVNATKVFAFPLIDYNISEEDKVSVNISIPNEEHKNAVPLYEWQIDNVNIVLNKTAWYIYILWAIATLALLTLILYYKILKSPLILELSENPNRLKTLDNTQLKEASFKLRLINQLESTLSLAEIEKEDFNNTIKFIKGNADEKIKLFTKHIGADEYIKEGKFYRINFSESFKLNSMKTFLLYITDEHPKNIKRKILSMNDKVFVVAKKEYQNIIATEAHDKTNRMVAHTVAQLTELLLSANAEEKFIKILANCLSFKDVSPYQLKGDVKSEDNFFGRVEILREIISNDNSTNYLLVGARKLGKSSILKALERRYSESNKVECYYFTLTGTGDVLAEMSEALGLALDSNLEQVSKAIKRKAETKKPVFLIDEADVFVKNEKASDYLITSVFRKLSQEGDAMFILAGFWTLYEYVTLDYQSPLQNFGKLMVLGGLEVEACKELMVEPMKRIGIGYEDESIVDETIKLCGYRANYIATVCDEVLKALKTSVIRKVDVEEALESIAVNEMLKGWSELSGKVEENRIDRFIVYLTIGKESFRLSDIVDALEDLTLTVEIEEINKSLDRLVLAYILKDRKGNYAYLIPLFKERLLEKDLGYLLKGTADEIGRSDCPLSDKS